MAETLCARPPIPGVRSPGVNNFRQVGAAIGREFSHALLSAVVSKPEPALVLALDRLIAAGLLFRQGLPPHSSYLFKQALVQDAAYGTLLREPTRDLKEAKALLKELNTCFHSKGTLQRAFYSRCYLRLQRSNRGKT